VLSDHQGVRSKAVTFLSLTPLPFEGRGQRLGKPFASYHTGDISTNATNITRTLAIVSSTECFVVMMTAAIISSLSGIATENESRLKCLLSHREKCTVNALHIWYGLIDIEPEAEKRTDALMRRELRYCAAALACVLA